MLFNSSQFLIFLPVVLFFYYITPPRKILRQAWLLICSYYFYMCWNAAYALLLLFSTIITYLCGLSIEYLKTIRLAEKSKHTLMTLCLIFSLFSNLSILFFFKYFDFSISLINNILNIFNIQITNPSFDIMLPVGISFYIFQSLGYTIDVYRNEIYAERNFITYALFVSFFPQLVAGPIERSKNLLKQLNYSVKFQFDNMRDGLFLMLWGYFQKVVIADRIAIFVDTIYSPENFTNYSGTHFIVATILFAFQILCDFSGYSTIAMGTARTLGITLMENFSSPYYAQSTSEFWRRWHISLSTWFRDYLYIPLGGSRKGRIRKYWNLIITFSISGLWHGANWHFVIWGIMNGLYQVIGDILKPIRQFFIKVFGLNEHSLSHKLLKVLITFICIDFSWIFFRANNFSQAVSIIKMILHKRTPWILFDGSLYNYGLSQKNFFVMIYGILILIIADGLKYKGIIIRDIIQKQDWWFQILIIVFSIWIILLLGIWGNNYDASSFIYFQF